MTRSIAPQPSVESDETSRKRTPCSWGISRLPTTVLTLFPSPPRRLPDASTISPGPRSLGWQQLAASGLATVLLRVWNTRAWTNEDAVGSGATTFGPPPSGTGPRRWTWTARSGCGRSIRSGRSSCLGQSERLHRSGCPLVRSRCNSPGRRHRRKRASLRTRHRRPDPARTRPSDTRLRSGVSAVPAPGGAPIGLRVGCPSITEVVSRSAARRPGPSERDRCRGSER